MQNGILLLLNGAITSLQSFITLHQSMTPIPSLVWTAIPLIIPILVRCRFVLGLNPRPITQIHPLTKASWRWRHPIMLLRST
jgi:hypothetical protein